MFRLRTNLIPPFCRTFVTGVELLSQNNRVPLSRAITLIESTNPRDKVLAEELIQFACKHNLTHPRQTSRIGVTGPPGVGKSSFIEALGMHILSANEKNTVAVLAVDPSSSLSGGSILGDKTRMTELSRHPRAYVRPSPSRGSLGGVTRVTHEAILLCETAGYDYVLVETVGVGQSEVAVEDMTDMFLLLANPSGGDELQGIKRGIMELADLLIVNKDDGVFTAAANKAKLDLRNALKLLAPKSPNWQPTVLKTSTLTGSGLPDINESIVKFFGEGWASGHIPSRRGQQGLRWMWTLVADSLMDRVRASPSVQAEQAQLCADVLNGRTTSVRAADRLLNLFLASPPHPT